MCSLGSVGMFRFDLLCKYDNQDNCISVHIIFVNTESIRTCLFCSLVFIFYFLYSYNLISQFYLDAVYLPFIKLFDQSMDSILFMN